MLDRKLSCARTKREAIAKNVSGQLSEEDIWKNFSWSYFFYPEWGKIWQNVGRTNINFVIFEVRTTVAKTNNIFWDVTPCNLVEDYQRSSETSENFYHTILRQAPEDVTLNTNLVSIS
jgi:hypothetical protein